MGRVAFIWDLEGDSEGNYWHICVEGHGVTREEVEEVLRGITRRRPEAAAAPRLRRLAGRQAASP